MVVGFTTTYAVSPYHHWCCEFKSWSGWGVQQCVIKFVSDLRQVSGFLWVLWSLPPIKLSAMNDIIEILLKVALNTIKQTNKQTSINLDVSSKLSSSKWIYVASIPFYNLLSMEEMKLKIIIVNTFYSIPKRYITQFLSCTCSVWAGKLH